MVALYLIFKNMVMRKLYIITFTYFAKYLTAVSVRNITLLERNITLGRNIT